MKDFIELTIKKTIDEYSNRPEIKTTWKEPLVGYADVYGDVIRNIKEITIPSHPLPEEILPEATIVVCYFLPFTEDIAKSNIKVEDNYASPEWAQAYEETNDLIEIINEKLVDELIRKGYKAINVKDRFPISEEYQYSHWSQRHMAYAAGLGTFGVNNLLISDVGCCGRYGSIVTNLDVVAGKPIEGTNCLYKFSNTCLACVKSCFTDSLAPDYTLFKRNVCAKICERNSKRYGEKRTCCGKCAVGLPCSHKNPIKMLKR